MGIPGSCLLVTVSFVFFTLLASGSCSTIKLHKVGNRFRTVKPVHSDGQLSSSGIGNPDFGSVLNFITGLKDFTVQNLLEAKPWNGDKFLSSMVSSLISSTSSDRALKHLQSLKTTLLNQFHKKARELVTGRSKAEARDPHHGHHGGIGFPSLEGALLSLAFLTFAVFLIDLIQQLVSRYRTGYAVPLGRRRRSITEYPHVTEHDNHQSASLTSHVLSAIENPLLLNTIYDL